MEENLAARQRLGERIRQLRTLRNLTQEKLAELVGNTSNHIGQVERGEVNVTIDILFAIARHLLVHPRELFDATPEELEGKRIFVVSEPDFNELRRAAEIIDRIKTSRP